MNYVPCRECNNRGFIVIGNDYITCPSCTGDFDDLTELEEQVCEHCNNTGMIGDSLRYCYCKIGMTLYLD